MNAVALKLVAFASDGGVDVGSKVGKLSAQSPPSQLVLSQKKFAVAPLVPPLQMPSPIQLQGARRPSQSAQRAWVVSRGVAVLSKATDVSGRPVVATNASSSSQISSESASFDAENGQESKFAQMASESLSLNTSSTHELIPSQTPSESLSFP